MTMISWNERVAEGLQYLQPPTLYKYFFENLKIWCTNADTLTSSKRNELAARVKLYHTDIIIITDINPANSIHDITEENLEIDDHDIMK